MTKATKMLDLFDRFAVNLDAEVEGVWRDFYGAQVLIARSGNEKFNDALSKVYTENEEALGKKGTDEEKAEADTLAARLMNEVFADTLILGWEGMGFKGEELEYSRDNVIKLFSDPSMRDLRIELLTLADDAEAYRLKREGKQKKNS